MNLSIFEEGLTIQKMRGYLDVVYSLSEERQIPLIDCCVINNLSTEETKYMYFCSFGLNKIKTVNLLRKRNNMFGLSLYDIQSQKVVDITECEYDNIKTPCFDTFVLEKRSGQNALVVKGKILFNDFNFIEVFDFFGFINVVAVCDTSNRFHYIFTSHAYESFSVLHSIQEFFSEFGNCVNEYRRLDYLSNVTLGDFDLFKEQVSGYMLVHGFCH